MLDLLDIRQDYIFKLIFAHEGNKKILIGLLNAILKDKPHVYDIEIQNPEIPKILKDNRGVILDIKAKIGEHSYVDIEMQAQAASDMVDRGIQYLANMLTRHAKRAPENVLDEEIDDWDYSYPKVIGIWILGKKIKKDYGPSPVNEAVMTFKPTEMQDYQIVSDKIRLFTIELPKFNPKNQARRDMLDNWMAFFKDPLDEEALENEDINQAFRTLKELSADDKVRYEAEALENGRLSLISAKNTELRELREELAMAEEEKKGILEKAEAREKELVENARREKLESARKMLSDGLTVEMTAKYSGLTIDEVKGIQI